MNKNRIRGVNAGRASRALQSPYPSSAGSVDPATVRGRRLELPQEICPVSCNATEGAERRPDRRAEVSRGHSSSGNGGKARTRGVGSRDRTSWVESGRKTQIKWPSCSRRGVKLPGSWQKGPKHPGRREFSND